jgi:hypothetical protein
VTCFLSSVGMIDFSFHIVFYVYRYNVCVYIYVNPYVRWPELLARVGDVREERQAVKLSSHVPRIEYQLTGM